MPFSLGALALAAVAAGSIHAHAALPHATYGTRDAPLLSVSLGYTGPGYARNLRVTVSVTHALVRGQPGTQCDPPTRERRIVCNLLPVANGATAPLNILVTHLTPGPLRIQVAAVGAGSSAPVMRSTTSFAARVLPCPVVVRTSSRPHCR